MTNLEEVEVEEVERLYCCVCGEELTEGEAMYFEDEWYCRTCLDESTYLCACCGTRVSEDDVISDENIDLCQHCFENYYYRCNVCSRIIPSDDVYCDEDDDDIILCHDCYNKERNSVIHGYGYKPYPLFYGKGNRFFGVELEVDEGGKDKNNAAAILDIANDDDYEHIYIKSDGSLNDGMELVSHPCTLDYHKNKLPWERIMKKLIGLGYLSHRTNTCGLHIHVNRTAFGNTTDEQEEAIARVIYFIEHHWEEMLKFSRRTQSQIEQWAARYGRKDNPKEFIEDVKNGGYKRYACVNLQNYNTIEFRMFRGTLRYNTFVATLQLVDEICNAAVSMSDENMEDLSWDDFISNLNYRSHSELITYLKERNLYLNKSTENIESKEADE